MDLASVRCCMARVKANGTPKSPPQSRSSIWKWYNGIGDKSTRIQGKISHWMFGKKTSRTTAKASSLAERFWFIGIPVFILQIFKEKEREALTR